VVVLQQNDRKYQEIAAMEKVKTANNPGATTLALFLQDMEHQCISEVATMALAAGARIMSYVFDGLYIMALDEENLHSIYREVATSIFDRLGVKIALKGTDGEKLSQIKFDEACGQKRPSVADDCLMDEPLGSAKSQRLEA